MTDDTQKVEHLKLSSAKVIDSALKRLVGRVT